MNYHLQCLFTACSISRVQSHFRPPDTTIPQKALWTLWLWSDLHDKVRVTLCRVEEMNSGAWKMLGLSLPGYRVKKKEIAVLDILFLFFRIWLLVRRTRKDINILGFTLVLIWQLPLRTERQETSLEKLYLELLVSWIQDMSSVACTLLWVTRSRSSTGLPHHK